MTPPGVFTSTTSPTSLPISSATGARDGDAPGLHVGSCSPRSGSGSPPRCPRRPRSTWPDFTWAPDSWRRRSLGPRIRPDLGDRPSIQPCRPWRRGTRRSPEVARLRASRSRRSRGTLHGFQTLQFIVEGCEAPGGHGTFSLRSLVGRPGEVRIVRRCRGRPGTERIEGPGPTSSGGRRPGLGRAAQRLNDSRNISSPPSGPAPRRARRPGEPDDEQQQRSSAKRGGDQGDPGSRRSSGAKRAATGKLWAQAARRPEISASSTLLSSSLGELEARWRGGHGGRSRRDGPPLAVGQVEAVAGVADEDQR